MAKRLNHNNHKNEGLHGKKFISEKYSDSTSVIQALLVKVVIITDSTFIDNLANFLVDITQPP